MFARMRLSLLCGVVLAMTALWTRGQFPSGEGQALQVPAQLPDTAPKKVEVQPKSQDKKPEAKKDDKPPVVPDAPQLTERAGTGPQAPPSLAPASAAVLVSALPPVYGDMLGATRYSPYLIATLPRGTQQAVRPGQVATFPLGTTFSQNVPTQIVQVQVGTQVIFDPQTEQRIEVPIFENRVQVVGPPAQAATGSIPVNVVRGAFKIAENESPRPVDRVYLNYNYFYDVNPSLSVPELPVSNVHRETFGLEKTFLDENASIGLRLPLLQLSGSQNFQGQGFGDLSIVMKYAFINEYVRMADGSLGPGNVLSGGLVVTAPTGNVVTFGARQPPIHTTYLQPWVGGILVRGDFYMQGFSSVAVPMDNRDTTFFFNSLQFGYRLFQASSGSDILTSVTPVVEVHVTNPLNNRNIQLLPIGAADIVSLTSGATFGLGSRSFLNLGANVPVTGPKPYGIEAVAQLNIRY